MTANTAANTNIHSPTTTPFPTGLDDANYLGSRIWSSRRYAWEFLRRNQDYQTFCLRVINGEVTNKATIKTTLTEQFGLLKFKSYLENYQPNRPRFTSSEVSYWSDISNTPYSVRKNINIELGPGEIIFRLSLKSAAISTKSLGAHLRSIEKLLNLKSEHWRTENSAECKTPRERVSEYLPLLRIIDLVNYTLTLPQSEVKSRSELFEIVYPRLARTATGTPAPKGAFNSQFDDKRVLAFSYTKPDRYLDLAAT